MASPARIRFAIRYRSILNLKFWFLTVLATLFSVSLAAETVDLTLDQARLAAQQATINGDITLARALADGLLQADPNDRSALVVLAAVLPQLGEATQGRQAGARAFRLSQSNTARYEAARLTALAAANEERFTLAQIWLRRAAANAPDETALAITQRDFRGIRSINPLSIDLGFSLKPSSNVNGGASGRCLEIDTFADASGNPICAGVLSGDAQALSGYIGTANARLAYTLNSNATSRTRATFQAAARQIWLSQEARQTVPTARNSDFSSQTAELGLQHEVALESGRLVGELIYGTSWFGGEKTAEYYRVIGRYQTPLNDSTLLTLLAQSDSIYLPQTLTQRTNQARTLGATLDFRRQNQDRLSMGLRHESQTSESVNEGYDRTTFQLGYAWANQDGPINFATQLGVSVSTYPDYTLPFVPIPDGRKDTRVFASVTAAFNDLDYAGFTPTVTIGFQDTNSNVSRFERDEVSIGFNFRSSF